ncbi:SDR family oxidoreductase [Rhodococcus sp. NPDC127530]|uniref:SDR family oxidoreductase n=1 Tax=unclassified Rhodococcus (in: high G+C Gram-positive bacteria) TaxID=192944 RepID=UPI00363C3287
MSSSFKSVLREGSLADRVILVTGGGTGIGRCIAHEVASLGAVTLLAGRRAEPLEQVAREIADAGGQADFVSLNIRDADSVERAVSSLVDKHGRIDGLVNNAGGQFPAPVEDISPNGWRSVIDLNLTGTFLVSRAVYRSSMQTHGGSIVSIVANMWNGMPFMAHTGAARAGVVNLTQTMALEWASHAVRVNAVAPGVILSSGMDTYTPEQREGIAQQARGIPAGRIGTESEVSGATAFLLTDAASFITGETLKIDGAASLLPQPMMPMAAFEPMPIFDGFHLAQEIPEFWNPAKV